MTNVLKPSLLKESISSMVFSAHHKKQKKKSKLEQKSLFVRKNSLNNSFTLPEINTSDNYAYRKLQNNQPLIKVNQLDFEKTQSKVIRSSLIKSKKSEAKVSFLRVKISHKIKINPCFNPTSSDPALSSFKFSASQAQIKGFSNKFLSPASSKNLDISLDASSAKFGLSYSTNSTLNSYTHKDSSDDPFHYSNMVKNSNLSSFSKILHGKNKPGGSSFPYCSRIPRPPSIHKTFVKKTLQKLSKNLDDCECLSKSFSFSEYANETFNFLPKTIDFKDFIPKLSRIHFYPQQVVCFKNLIIVNFEGALGYFSNILNIKLQT